MLAAFYFISFCSMLDFELTFLPSTLNTFLTRHSICRQDVLLASFFWQAPDMQACTSAAAYSSTVFLCLIQYVVLIQCVVGLA